MNGLTVGRGTSAGVSQTSSPEGLRKSLLPGLGFGTCVALLHWELWVAALVVFIVTTVVTVVADKEIRRSPRSLVSDGTVQRATTETDADQSSGLRYLAAPGVAFLASTALEPAPVDPLLTGPLVFLAMTATSTWAFMRIMNRDQRAGRRHVTAALGKASFDTATRSRIEAVSTPPGRTVCHALLTIGAVDGIQVRFWRLNKVSGLVLEDLREECRRLARLGLVRNSGIDAGGDLSRHLTELTPIGLRTLWEARSR